MSKFLSPLCMQYMVNDAGTPLKNPDGRQIYQVISPLSYDSDVAGRNITVPAGFLTDLASIPRLPFFYRELSNVADLPGVVHDYLYSNGCVSRDVADLMLKEMCLLVGLPYWKTQAIYMGVRLGGESHFNQDNESNPKDYKEATVVIDESQDSVVARYDSLVP